MVLKSCVTFRSQMHLCITTTWEERRGRWLVHYWLKTGRVRAGSELHADLVASFLWWCYCVTAQSLACRTSAVTGGLSVWSSGRYFPTFLHILSSSLVFCRSCMSFCFQSYSLATLVPATSIDLIAAGGCQPPLILPCFLLPVPKLNFASWRMRTVSLLYCKLFLC